MEPAKHSPKSPARPETSAGHPQGQGSSRLALALSFLAIAVSLGSVAIGLCAIGVLPGVQPNGQVGGPSRGAGARTGDSRAEPTPRVAVPEPESERGLAAEIQRL
jgi:hypothetical protein